MKNNFIFNIYKTSITSQRYTLIFILSIVISLYGVMQIAYSYSYCVGFIRILTFGIYILSLLLILLLNTSLVYKIYEDNYFYILRLKSKKIIDIFE